MEFDNSFEVPLPPAEAWKVLLDIERIAPCMPGAELTEVVGDDTYKGRIAVRLGPVALTFAGVVRLEQIDAAGHTARVSASSRGQARRRRRHRRRSRSPAWRCSAGRSGAGSPGCSGDRRVAEYFRHRACAFARRS